MHNPLVSVIIPNYCHAKYLDQRIQSVLNQTYQNFEVIILDDASPDNGASKAVIEKYRNNPHVSHIIYNEVNSGSTFKQWNKGLKLAKGELIWIAESDDYCEFNFLETLIPCWDEYPNCSVVESALWHIDNDGKKIYPDRSFSGCIQYYKGIDFIKSKMVQSNYYIPNASAVIFKKNISMKIENNYMNFRAAGDRLFWIYMLELGDICIIDKPLNYFRQHQVNLTPKREMDGTQGRENYQINSYLKKKGFLKGLVYVEAYYFYMNYFQTQEFESENTRKELLNLWFPWWKRTIIFRAFIKLYYILTIHK